MSKITDMLFGTHSQRELKRIEPLVKKIEELIGKSMFTQDTLFDLQLALIIQRIYHLQG